MNSVLSMEQQFLKKLVEIVEDNFNNEQFQVTDLASEMGMSRATLHRKVKATTGKTITQFINEIRINAAKELLVNRSGTVAEVAYMVGFGSSTYFIKCFHEHFGYSPGEVLKENFQKVEADTKKERNAKQKFPFILKISIPILFVIVVFLVFQVVNNRQVNLELPKPSTQNQAALNLYLQGIKLMDVYTGSQDAEHFIEAEKKYNEAIKLDSSFGDAYTRLAEIYLLYKPYSDSGLVNIEKAEHFGVGDNDFLLRMKSIFYQSIQNYDEALRILELCWEGREKNYNYYYERGNHAYFMRDYATTIENLLTYFQLKPASEIPQYDGLMKLALTFSRAGFEEEAQEFAYRQFKLINDSVKYWSWYPRIIYETGNLQRTIDYYESAYKNNELGTTVFNKLLEMYMLTGQTNAGLKILPEYMAYNKNISSALMPNYLMAYYQFISGNKNLSFTHFRNEIRRWEYFSEATETQESLSKYLTIAACYSMLNEKEGTLKSLQKLATKSSTPFLVVLHLQKSPMFDNFIQDEDFKKIRKEIEDNYYSEHTSIQNTLNEYQVELTYKQKKVITIEPN